MLPNVLGGGGIGRAVPVKQWQRVDYLHSGSLGEGEQVVYFRAIQKSAAFSFHRTASHTKVAKTEILEQGDELRISRGEKIPGYTMPIGALGSRFKTKSAEIRWDGKTTRIADGQQHRRLRQGAASQATNGDQPKNGQHRVIYTFPLCHRIRRRK